MEENAMRTKDDLLVEQMKLLSAWNEKNIDSEPEQVRANVALIIELSKGINKNHFFD